MRRFAYLTAVFALVTTTLAAGFPVYNILRNNTYHVAGGTAFTVTYKDKTYMVSNWHVCRNFEKTEAKNEEKGFSYTAKVLKVFPSSDLCLLSTSQTSGIEVGKDLAIGMPIYIAGYPQYAKKLQLRQGHTLNLGTETLDFGTDKECPPEFNFKIKSDDKSLKFESVCEHSQMIMDTTAEGTHGNSGSPVVNSKGKLVGIVHSADNGKCERTRTCKMHYIPVSELIKILDSLETESP